MIGNVRRKGLNRPDILQHPTVVFEPGYVILDQSVYGFFGWRHSNAMEAAAVIYFEAIKIGRTAWQRSPRRDPNPPAKQAP
jgi:hypothetical protein